MSHIWKSYYHRIMAIMRSRKFDLIWIEKECLPWIPAWVELSLLKNGTPYVLDYDDAVFHYYDQHSKGLVRRILGQKHTDLIRNASLVIAGNEYLNTYARQAGAHNVVVIPTAIDLERYPVPKSKAGTTVTLPHVGWIGQRSTAHFLRPLAPLFSELEAQGKGRFSAIGIDTKAFDLPMHSIPWSESTEVASISSLDVGIMPLVDGPFERGKCGYKLIQYMACGIPVIASPVGVNGKIVEQGRNGFLAATDEDWNRALSTLLENPELRKEMGAEGRQIVENEYCIQVTGPRLVQSLAKLV
ncbi:glycosyltransferase [Pigmentiphaga humi]|uniref:glycosyltransferase n=1 Tax=Pigmentiphaga humi TaxID=2478468 RepID=UPI001FEA6C72|nr:glycosyltransferase [Pigmentiphaga humi]